MAKILLVEDDKSLREIYGVRLLAEGYDIISAGDGEEALAMAIKDRPDLIVSDVMMPKISGFDMLDILRSTTETKGIKVIMMTALSSEEQRQRGVSLGADRYLVKSQVGIEDVVRTVHEVLADAPVVGTPVAVAPTPAAPVVSAPPQPAPAPVVSVPPRPETTPIAAVPAVTPPVPAPIVQPVPAPAPAAPVPASATPTPTEPVLPQPSTPAAPARTTGNSISERVIQPLEAAPAAPDFGSMMSQELGSSPEPASAPISPQPVVIDTSVPPTPPPAPNTGI